MQEYAPELNRRIKPYLREVDHSWKLDETYLKIRGKCRYRQWFKIFATAGNTIDGLESIRMIQKGQILLVAKSNIGAQNDFIHQLLGLAS